MEKLLKALKAIKALFGTIITIISIIIPILIFPITLVWYHYCREEALIKHNNSRYNKIGYDLTQMCSWLFSADALLFILVGAVLTLVVFVIFYVTESSSNDNKIELTALTLTITMSTLIPFLISRIVAKSHLNEIIEKKLEAELNNFKTSLYSIRRDKGHSCRMSAELLCQSASAEKKNNVDNAIWSIGWASEAITQYLLIRDKYNNAKERITECMESIYKSYMIIKDQKGSVKHRDIISLLTMYTLLKKYCMLDDIKDSVIEKKKKEYKKVIREEGKVKDKDKIEEIINKRIEDEIVPIEHILQYFYKNREEKKKLSGNLCRITGMNDDDFNREVESEAECIIKSLEERK